MELEAIAVVGPTASGKTRRAVQIAGHFNGEIISGDSRQIYRGMTIGTGKDLCEYGNIPYHLIDIAEAGEKYNLHRYLTDFRKAFTYVTSKGKLPVICGGTGMYVENALNGIIMPEVERNQELRDTLADKSLEELTSLLSQYKLLHNSTDVDTKARALRALEIADYYSRNPEAAAAAKKETAIPINALIIGIDIPREKRREKISLRLNARLKEGMLDEVKSLLERNIPPQDLIYYGLEYKFTTLYLIGQLSYEEMFTQLETAIHQFAKRQMTWFRGMQTRGHEIHWLPYDMDDEDFIESVGKLMNNYRSRAN